MQLCNILDIPLPLLEAEVQDGALTIARTRRMSECAANWAALSTRAWRGSRCPAPRRRTFGGDFKSLERISRLQTLTFGRRFNQSLEWACRLSSFRCCCLLDERRSDRGYACMTTKALNPQHPILSPVPSNPNPQLKPEAPRPEYAHMRF